MKKIKCLMPKMKKYSLLKKTSKREFFPAKNITRITILKKWSLKLLKQLFWVVLGVCFLLFESVQYFFRKYLFTIFADVEILDSDFSKFNKKNSERPNAPLWYILSWPSHLFYQCPLELSRAPPEPSYLSTSVKLTQIFMKVKTISSRVPTN